MIAELCILIEHFLINPLCSNYYSILEDICIEDINFDAIKGRAWREKVIRPFEHHF